MKRNPITVPFVSMPADVIDDLLKAAALTEHDVLCDLGCGDGRVLVEAARRTGARGIGLDNNRELLERAHQGAVEAGVAGKIDLYEGNFERNETLQKIGITHATVIVLYLLPEIISRLLPNLFTLLKPGVRIYSYAFQGEENVPLPNQTISTWSLGGLENGSHIYVWEMMKAER